MGSEGSVSFHVLIPARLASTRLPGKPLLDIAGMPMVVRAARQAQAAGARSVTVAADDATIVAACAEHGIDALLTRTDHVSGSDRLAEACTLLGLDGDDVVVNVQGDEPLMPPALIRSCAELLVQRGDCVMSTAAHVIADSADFTNPNVVKVVLDTQGRALYFSRAAIPHWRDAEPGKSMPHGVAALRHIGIYAYRAAYLRGFPQLPPCALETTEALEQLRVLWHGDRIAVAVTSAVPGPGVDTPADLARVRALMERNGARAGLN